MAGEWIKVESSTPNKPELMRVSRILGVDRDLVFGKLMRLWSWFDINSVDGHVDGVVSTDVDTICACDGFANALSEVGWIVCDDEKEVVSLPNFDRHNGETAKHRALKNKRQSKWRDNVDANVDAAPSTKPSTKASTREEKRREYKKKDIGANESHPTVSDAEWLSELSQNSAYAGMDVQREFAKMQAWCATNRKQATRRRFINWLNRAERPMAAAQQTSTRPAITGNVSGFAGQTIRIV